MAKRNWISARYICTQSDGVLSWYARRFGMRRFLVSRQEMPEEGMEVKRMGAEGPPIPIISRRLNLPVSLVESSKAVPIFLGLCNGIRQKRALSSPLKVAPINRHCRCH